jgi:hypothetical protein
MSEKTETLRTWLAILVVGWLMGRGAPDGQVVAVAVVAMFAPAIEHLIGMRASAKPKPRAKTAAAKTPAAKAA